MIKVARDVALTRINGFTTPPLPDFIMGTLDILERYSRGAMGRRQALAALRMGERDCPCLLRLLGGAGLPIPTAAEDELRHLASLLAAILETPDRTI
ncbi:hypothetical protein [Noviherbaspirillum aerium]|uniref:hypothetical protein n=1 Tax=Noviherbaspirillum aerium TaxID=2588497 RepID=UPI00124E01F4|nr:hypothetical protein [Noviherbaspirillum aerium]